MALPRITVEGRLGADPSLRFIPSGKAVSDLRICATQQKKVNDEWVDDKSLWIDATIWGQYAENVAESFRKGDAVVVSGRLETQEWNNEAGEKRSKIHVLADEVAIPLRFRQVPHGSGQATRTQTRDNPTTDPYQTGGGAAASTYDEPPF